MSLIEKFKKSVIAFICLGLLGVGQVWAQTSPTPTNFQELGKFTNFDGVVIDERCVREKLMDPGGDYARECEKEDNTETEIICINKKYPEDEGFLGLFNLFKTTLRITPETLPYLIRNVMIVAFAVLGVAALWMTIWGYYKWVGLINDSPDEATKVWKMFTNGLFGMLFALGSVALTWGIFYAAGVRQSNEEFFNIGEQISGYLSFPCEDLNSTACSKYNYSCKMDGRNCRKARDSEKLETIRTLGCG